LWWWLLSFLLLLLSQALLGNDGVVASILSFLVFFSVATYFLFIEILEERCPTIYIPGKEPIISVAHITHTFFSHLLRLESFLVVVFVKIPTNQSVVYFTHKDEENREDERKSNSGEH